MLAWADNSPRPHRRAVGAKGSQVRIKEGDRSCRRPVSIIAEIRGLGCHVARPDHQGPERARHPHTTRGRVAAGSGKARAGACCRLTEHDIGKGAPCTAPSAAVGLGGPR
jgi:hypothetical protein